MFLSIKYATHFFSIIGLFFCISCADNAFMNIKSDINIHNGTNKVWYNYIQTFLEICAMNMEFEFIYTLNRYAKFSSHFEASTFSTQDLSPSKRGRPTLVNHRFVCSYDIDSEFGNQVNKKASGKLEVFRESPMWCVPCKDSHIWQLQWQVFFLFNPDWKIALNFTFHAVTFSPGPALCQEGRLMVHNFAPRISPFFFCSNHSLFNLYPFARRLMLHLKVDHHSFFNFTTTFSVMDTRLLHNLNCHSKLNFLLVYIFSNGAALYFYKIDTMKCYQLILALLSHNKYIIYDAPGLFSTSVKMSPGKVKMSTFQCIVTIIETNASVCENDQISFFKFSSMLIHQSSEHIITQNINIQLPSQTCSPPVCVILFMAPMGHVNVTVLSMAYHSVYMFDCIYGGLVSGEQLSTGYHESAVVCDNTQDHHVPRMLYSHKSSMLVVLYWYEPHSMINATIKISETKCHVVKINSCEFHRKCIERPKRCLSFDTRVNRQSNVSLTTSTAGGMMFFHLAPADCNVIQMFARKGKMWSVGMQMDVVSTTDPWQNFVEWIPIPCPGFSGKAEWK